MFERLTRPHPSIQNETRRRRVRLFLAIIFMDGVISLFSVLPLSIVLGPERGVLAMAALVGASIGVYGLGRTRYVQIAIHLATLSVYLIVLAIIVTAPSGYVAMDMLFPILIASLFSTLPVMLFWSLICIGSVAVLALALPGDWSRPVTDLSFLVSTGLITGVNAYLRDQDARRLQADLTFQQSVEQALRESNQRYDELVANMPGMSYRLRRNPEGVFSFDYLSPRCLALNGVPAEDVLRNPSLLINQHYPEDQPEYARRLEESAQRLTPFMWEGRVLVNGQIRWRRLESNVRRLADGTLIWDGIQLDTTAQRVTEEQLRESQYFIEHITQAVPDIVYVSDVLREASLYTNSQVTHVLGYTPHALTQMGDKFIHALLHPDDLDAYLRNKKQQLSATDGEVTEFEYRMKHADGTWRWLNSREIVFKRNEYGQPSQILGIAQDVSAHKNAEIAESERRTLADAIHETAALLNSTLDLDEVLDHILASINRVVPYDGAKILLVEGDQAHVVRSQGYDAAGESLLPEQRVPVANNFVVKATKITQKAVWISDTALVADFTAPPGIDWIRSCVGVPIWAGGQLIGTLHLDSRTLNFYTAVHAERLQTFATQVATAIQNAQMHAQSQLLTATNERQRLARELHDSVTQTLFSASMVAQTLPLLWEGNPATVRTELDHLAKLTRGALSEMRTLLVELRPAALNSADLADLLGYLLDALATRNRLQTALTVQGQHPPPPDVQVVAYRIAQEALNNVAKHARAKCVDVSLIRAPDCLKLTIRDDGRGFNMAQASGDHFGLSIMRERAETIGALFSIDSAPGYGCALMLVWQSKPLID